MFERKILRRIYRGKVVEVLWETNTNINKKIRRAINGHKSLRNKMAATCGEDRGREKKELNGGKP